MATVISSKPTLPRSCYSMRLFKLLVLIFVIGICSYTFYSTHHQNSTQIHHLEKLVISLNQEVLRLQHDTASLIQHGDHQKREATSHAPNNMSIESVSDDFRDIILQELGAMRTAQRDMQRRQDLMREQYMNEIDVLKKEVLALKRDLEISRLNSFNEKNANESTSERKEQVKESFTEWVKSAHKTASESFEGFTSYIKEKVPKAANDIKDSAKNGYEKVKNYVDENAPKAADKIKSSAKDTMETVKSFSQDVGASAKKGFDRVKNFVDEKTPEVVKAGKKAKEGFEKMKGYVEEKAPKVAKKISETAKESFETMKSFVGENAPKVASKVQDSAKEALKEMKVMGAKAGEVVANQAKKLSDSLFSLFGR